MSDKKDRYYEFNKIICSKKFRLDVKDELLSFNTFVKGSQPITLLSDAKKRFQKYMGKKRYYHDLVRFNSFIDHFSTISDDIDKNSRSLGKGTSTGGDVLYNETFMSCRDEFFDSDINCNNNVEVLFALWDYLNLNKGFLGELTFSISDLSSMLQKPTEADLGISVGQVIFDELCTLLTFVLVTDARAVGNILRDSIWHKLILHKPINLLTWQTVLKSVMPIFFKRPHIQDHLFLALLSTHVGCEGYTILKRMIMLLFHHPATLILMQFPACKGHLSSLREILLQETITDPNTSTSLICQFGNKFIDKMIDIILENLDAIKKESIVVPAKLLGASNGIGAVASPSTNVEVAGIDALIRDLADVLIAWTKCSKKSTNSVSSDLNATDTFNCSSYSDTLKTLMENVLLPSNFKDPINWDFINPFHFYTLDGKVSLQSLYQSQLKKMNSLDITLHLISTRESESYTTGERVVVISTLLYLCINTFSCKDAQSKNDRMQQFSTISTTNISNSSAVSSANSFQPEILTPLVAPPLTVVADARGIRHTCIYTGFEASSEVIGDTWVYAQHFLADGALNDPPVTTPTVVEMTGYDFSGVRCTPTPSVTLKSFVTSLYAIEEITKEEEGLRTKRLGAFFDYITDDKEPQTKNNNYTGFFDKIPISAICRSIPIGFDRNRTQYWVFAAQENLPCESLCGFATDRVNSFKNEPYLFVKVLVGTTGQFKWFILRPSKIKKLLVLLENSPLPFERLLCVNIIERLAFTKKKLAVGVAFLKQLQVDWLGKYDMRFVDVFRRSLAALSEPSSSNRGNKSSTMSVEKLNIYETYYMRCIELRSLIHYALVYKGELELLERIDLNDNSELRRKRIKRLREILMDESFDHHPNKGFLRNDAFQRLRELFSTTTATRLMADGDIFNNYKFNMNRSQVRLMMDETSPIKWGGGKTLSEDIFRNKPLLGTLIGYDHRPMDLRYPIPNALIRATASEEDAEKMRLLQAQRISEVVIPVGNEFYYDAAAPVATTVKEDLATAVNVKSDSVVPVGSNVSTTNSTIPTPTKGTFSKDVSYVLPPDIGAVDKINFSDELSARPHHWLPEWDSFGPEGIVSQSRKAVVQLHNATGNVLRIYASGKDAAAFLGVSQSGISLCCSGTKTEAYGFKWRFYEGPGVDLSCIKQKQASYNQLVTMQITKNGKRVIHNLQNQQLACQDVTKKESSLSPSSPQEATYDSSSAGAIIVKQVSKEREDKLVASIHDAEFYAKCKFLKSHSVKEKNKEDPIITSSFYVNEKVGSKFEAPPPPLPVGIVDSSIAEPVDAMRASKRARLALPPLPVYDISELTSIDPTKATGIAYLNEFVYNDNVVVSRDLVSIKLMRAKMEILNILCLLPERRFLFTEENLNTFKKSDVTDKYLDAANGEYSAKMRQVVHSIEEKIANDTLALRQTVKAIADLEDAKAFEEAYAKVFAAHNKCIERVKRYFYRKIGLGLLLWNIQAATQPSQLYDVINCVKNILHFNNDRAIKDFDLTFLPTASMVRTSNDVAVYIFALDRALRYDNSEFHDKQQNPSNAFLVRRYGKARVTHVPRCYVNPYCHLFCSHLVACKTTSHTSLVLTPFGEKSFRIDLKSRIVGVSEVTIEEPPLGAASYADGVNSKIVYQKLSKADKAMKRKADRNVPDDNCGQTSLAPRHVIFEIAYDSFDHPVIAERIARAGVANVFDAEMVVPYLPPRYEIKDIMDV